MKTLFTLAVLIAGGYLVSQHFPSSQQWFGERFNNTAEVQAPAWQATLENFGKELAEQGERVTERLAHSEAQARELADLKQQITALAQNNAELQQQVAQLHGQIQLVTPMVDAANTALDDLPTDTLANADRVKSLQVLAEQMELKSVGAW